MGIARRLHLQLNAGHPRNRRESLEEVLKKDPKDIFARYALALECFNARDDRSALEQFQTLRDQHPDYLPAYYHFAQALKRLGRTNEASEVLHAGIELARRSGNSHALSELEAALEL